MQTHTSTDPCPNYVFGIHEHNRRRQKLATRLHCKQSLDLASFWECTSSRHVRSDLLQILTRLTAQWHLCAIWLRIAIISEKFQWFCKNAWANQSQTTMRSIAFAAADRNDYRTCATPFFREQLFGPGIHPPPIEISRSIKAYVTIGHIRTCCVLRKCLVAIRVTTKVLCR